MRRVLGNSLDAAENYDSGSDEESSTHSTTNILSASASGAGHAGGVGGTPRTAATNSSPNNINNLAGPNTIHHLSGASAAVSSSAHSADHLLDAHSNNTSSRIAGVSSSTQPPQNASINAHMPLHSHMEVQNTKNALGIGVGKKIRTNSAVHVDDDEVFEKIEKAD